ncbi:MAG: glycosyltransferase family 4 protein [Candidatus Nomurabacteria bacterium]|nr:MAG: glycosyltransferase family 4 protein [Candidatus Nomurabacteria bacterium]
MDIYYVANVRIPTEKAHGLQISKMCEAYAAQGHLVNLVVPRRKNSLNEDVFEFYGVSKNFKVTYLPIVTIFPNTLFGYYLLEVSFLFQLLWFFFRKEKKNEGVKVVTRDIFFALFFGRYLSVFYEMHDFPERYLKLFTSAIKNAGLVIVTNEWKKREVVNRFGLSVSDVLTAPNGFDPKLFSPNVIPVKRDKIGIPIDANIICYAGMLKTLGMDKGIRLLIEAAIQLPPGVVFLVIGGSEADIAEYQGIAEMYSVKEKFFFVGRVPHHSMASYLNVADAFVAPFPNTDHYRYYMSPIKLFEYMAMGKPVIASDLPSIREVLKEEGYFFSPDDVGDFISVASEVIAKRAGVSNQLLEQASKYTWSRRAENIISFMSKNVPEQKL